MRQNYNRKVIELDGLFAREYFLTYMDEKKITIFHIYRGNGTSIFLYPFSKRKNLIELLDKNEITGFYGKEPRVESLTLLRNELYRMIEQAVREWAAERRFLPRFLISTLLFLLLYFIMSFIIRDPVPMVDEILIGLAGAVGLYFFLAKRNADSKPATELKVRLRTKVDAIIFNEDSFTKDVEQYLQHCETTTDMEQLLMNIIGDESNIMFDYSDQEKVHELLESIMLLFDESDIRKHEKLLKKIAEEERSDVGRSRMLRWMSSKKVDPFLFAVYAKIIQHD